MPVNYLFKNGLRFVEPYFSRVYTSAQGRWVNKTILEVMEKEFLGRNIEKYRQMILSGDMTVERQQTDGAKKILQGSILFDERLEKNDLVSNSLHYHENPVLDAPIDTIFEDENVLVVNKPAGIPVHPTQGYTYNTVMEILKHERKIDKLYCCHRLDKVTSGVFIMAKNFDTYQSYYDVISNKRQVSKEYVARVTGRFPEGVVECRDDIVIVDPKKTYDRGGIAKPQRSRTTFELLKYDSERDESIVRCIPKTGRRHQLRIHLRNLGHPVANDPMYGPGALLSEPMTRAPGRGVFKKLRNLAISDIERRQLGDVCSVCQTLLYRDPEPSTMQIYLHSYKYGSVDGSWSYSAPMPAWAGI